MANQALALSQWIALGLLSAGFVTACGRSISGDASGASGAGASSPTNAAGAGGGGGAGATVSNPSPCAGLTSPKRLAITQAVPSEIDVRGGVLAALSGGQYASDGVITAVNLTSGATSELATHRQSMPANLSLSSEYAYWSENGLAENTLAGQTLFRARLDGSSAIELVISGLDPAQPIGPALVVGETLFLSTGGALESLAPAATQLVDIVPQANVLGLASDGQFLYWTSCGEAKTIHRVLSGGGAPEALADAFCPDALATDGKDVYFLGIEQPNGAPMYRIAASGGEPATASNLLMGAKEVLELDATNVYFFSSDGMFRLERATGNATMIAGGALTDFAIDDSCIYWADASDHGLYTAPKSATRSCQTDADCPNAKCVGASAKASGACSKLLGQFGESCQRGADCLNGYCVGGACTSGDNGDLCAHPTDCASQVCVPVPNRPPGVCSDGLTNSPCASTADCSNHECVHPIDAQGMPVPGSSVCTTGAPKEPCAVDADCANGGVCIAAGALAGAFVDAPSVCYTGQDQDFCRKPSDCQSTLCVLPVSGSGPGKCESGAVGMACAQAADCTSQFCLVPPSGSGGGPSYTCSTGALGAFCWTNDECQSGYCAPNVKAGLCAAPP